MNGGIMTQIYCLYTSLRHKKQCFREGDYIWKIGCNTMRSLLREVSSYTLNGVLTEDPEDLKDYGYLYGIKVERDENPDGLRILEDITLKL